MKKIIAMILVGLSVIQMCVFGAEFKDMPDDWSTSALEAAVSNGLLKGDNGYIKASDNMTRAEMATIMVRACGATRTADISSFTDVKAEDWYYDSMSKAVAMGAFKGSDNKLNPDDPITRQEAFVVLSRVFGVAAGARLDYTVLDSFKDKASIDSWAQKDVAAVVGQGYVAGSDGYIKPLDNISRAEFAVVMDRMIKYYIDEAVESIPTDGNVMIRTKDANLTGIKSEYSVVLGDAIGEVDITVKDAEMTGKLVIRSGKRVLLTGSYDIVSVVNSGITLVMSMDDADRIYVGKDSFFETMEVVGGEN